MHLNFSFNFLSKILNRVNILLNNNNNNNNKAKLRATNSVGKYLPDIVCLSPTPPVPSYLSPDYLNQRSQSVPAIYFPKKVCRREPTDNRVHATCQPRTRTAFPNTTLLITLDYLAFIRNAKVIPHPKLNFHITNK